MQIHNICITGSIVHQKSKQRQDEEEVEGEEEEEEEELHWRQRTIKFYDNSIVLKKNNFQLCLTKNVRYVLHLPDLKQIFQRRLEIEFHRQIKRLTFKIGNIHHSTKIDYNCKTLIQNFIPELKKEFEIEEVHVTQEQNAPVATTLSHLLLVGNFTFLCINLKLLDRTATIRLQVDKERIFTHATIILTRFNVDTQKLIRFFEQRELCASGR